ncbi:MAG: sensor histidine kinase [Arachidicoccus sp.]|nr:sensor histidine kinase [Arachidicoccus sp.]
MYVLCVILFLGITLPLPHLIVGWTQFGKNGNFPPPPFLNHDNHLPFSHNNHPFPDHAALQPPGKNISPYFFSLDEFRRHLYLYFTAFFFSFLLKTREHLSKLKEDKLNAELSSLKAQINPHFLFNTLNTIYALAIKKADNVSDAIVHLSGLMRYVTKDVNEHSIPLQKEVEYITNYIELQRARLGNTVKVYFDVFGETLDKRITPLILITYIENAFKYGVNPNVADCIISIKLDITDIGIVLHTFNKKVPNLNRAESTGIGMINTSERLKYLYPKKHFLKITETEKKYSVILSIELV